MKIKNFLNISAEYLVQPFKQGVRISPPDNMSNLEFSVKAISSINLSVYLMFEDTTLWCNEECAIISGFDKQKNAIGKSVRDVPNINIETITNVIQNNRQVTNTQRNIIVEENLIQKNEVIKNFLTFKMPCVDEQYRTIGVFGCSFMLGSVSLAKGLNALANLGFLRSNLKFNLKEIPHHIYLSKREVDILYHTIKGKSANLIASFLKLSKRTVEFYLENIKIKLNASSKADLIEKGLKYFNIDF